MHSSGKNATLHVTLAGLRLCNPGRLWAAVGFAGKSSSNSAEQAGGLDLPFGRFSGVHVATVVSDPL